MKSKRSVLIGCFVVLVALSQPVIGETDLLSPETVEIEKAVYFISPRGGPVTVPPGTYTLEAAEEELKLFPLEGGDILSIQAKATTHEETIFEPVTDSIQIQMSKM